MLTFDPNAFDNNAWVQDWGTWTLHPLQFLSVDRWYATLLYIGQGPPQGPSPQRTLTLGGWRQNGQPNQDYESHSVASATNPVHESWGTPATFLWGGPSFGSFPTFWDFPRMTLLSSGRAFMSGKDAGAARMQQPHNSGSQTAWDQRTLTPNFPTWTSSILVPNLNQQFDWVMRLCRADGGPNSFRIVEWCNANATPIPAWGSAGLPQLNTPRDHPGAVILPDASILVLNGEVAGFGPPKPELLRLRDLGWPGLQWVYGQDNTQFGGPRGYHSCAILLPDARVMVIGGEDRTWDYAIFKPYYLFLGPRPTFINNPPTEMRYQNSGLTYAFDTSSSGFGTEATKIVLIRPGMSTHHSDMEQRYVELQTVGVNDIVGGVQLVVTPPPSQNHAPLGWYMAFAVNAVGVPSIATWVKLIP